MTPFKFQDYAKKAANMLETFDWSNLEPLAQAIHQCWQSDNRIFMCGNGGSAANATHLVNDFLYGAAPNAKAIRATSLTDNPSIVTCLANDTSYDNVFSHQLHTLASPNDLLIVFSGSGNSANIISALNKAHELGMTTAAILGFTGGECKKLAQIIIHFDINDMQIAEDLQQIIGHMLTLWLRENPPTEQS